MHINDNRVLHMRRTYSIVNKFNEFIAIRLRYNYDLELTFMQRRAYAIMWYYMQYALKARVLVNMAVVAVMFLKGM